MGVESNLNKKLTLLVQTNNQTITHKVGLINLWEELGNISHACKVMARLRDTFHLYQQAVDEGDVDNLLDKNPRVSNGKNCIDEEIERPAVDYAFEYLAHGQALCSGQVQTDTSLKE